jgi:hypothetical protein
VRIVLSLKHNHPTVAADVLRFRDVGQDAETSISRLLQVGYLPSAALDMHKYDLQVEHGLDYVQYAGDRFHCPDLQWCYRLVCYTTVC